MALSRSSSSSFRYDVFLSFRGADTRHGFTGHLWKALHDSGIRTFIDDKEIESGKEITPSLVKAIEESMTAIIVFSKNYAFSSFCLDELSKILGCIKVKGLLVLPIFYDVDPSYVRKLTGAYGKAMTMQEKKFKNNKEKVQNWRKALHQAANLAGLHFKRGVYEYEFIGRIVEVVSKEISRAPLHAAHYPVGLDSRVLEVNSLLDVGSDDRDDLMQHMGREIVLEENKEHQAVSEKCQPASNDKTMLLDPMELESQLTYPEDQPVSNDESSHKMRSEYNQRSCWWQFCLCALITSVVSLCSSSTSLAAP